MMKLFGLPGIALILSECVPARLVGGCIDISVFA